MTRLLRVAFTAALMLAVLLALLPHPPDAALEVSDKAKHMTAFGVLTLLAMLAWPDTPRLRIAERLSFLGALIEVFQSIPALHRDCDVMDWIADSYIIIAVIVVTRIIAGPQKHGAAADATP